MVASNIDGNLRSKLLLILYRDSRVPISAIAKELHINYYLTRKTLSWLRKEKKLAYTVHLNCRNMGFDTERYIVIKFEKVPDRKLLIGEFSDDVFIQNAYLLNGDFDVLLHIVKASNAQYLLWEQTLRIRLSEFRPILMVFDKTYAPTGFLPLSSKLIRASPSLSDREKDILVVLNDSSRASINNIMAKTGLTHGTIQRTINNLKRKGVLIKTTIIISGAKNRIMSVFTLKNLKISYNHQKYRNQALSKLTSDDSLSSHGKYDYISYTSGYFDMLMMFEYKNSSEHYEYGPPMWQGAYKEEEVKKREATLIQVLVGFWPVHPKDYSGILDEMRSESLSRAECDKVRNLVKRGKIDEALKKYYSISSQKYPFDM